MKKQPTKSEVKVIPINTLRCILEEHYRKEDPNVQSVWISKVVVGIRAEFTHDLVPGSAMCLEIELDKEDE